MLKYIVLIVGLINPLSYMNSNILPKFSALRPSMVSMALPPAGKGEGNTGTKLMNSALAPKNGCRQNISTEYHSDGSKTVRTTITCTKEEKYDRDGKAVKKSDTSVPKYQTAQQDFFGNSSKDLK